MRPSTLIVLLATLGSSLAGLVPTRPDVDNTTPAAAQSSQDGNAPGYAESSRNRTTLLKRAPPKKITATKQMPEDHRGGVAKPHSGISKANAPVKAKGKAGSQAPGIDLIIDRKPTFDVKIHSEVDVFPAPGPLTAAEKAKAVPHDQLNRKSKSGSKHGADKYTGPNKHSKRGPLLASSSDARNTSTIRNDSPRTVEAHLPRLAKRDRPIMEVQGGQLEDVGPHADIAARNLAICTAILAMDSRNYKVLAHICPPGDPAYPGWSSQYNRFKDRIATKLEDKDGLRFYLSIPSLIPQKSRGTEVADGVMGRTKRIFFEGHTNTMIVVERVKSDRSQYWKQQDGSVEREIKHPVAYLETFATEDGQRVHVGGGWVYDRWNELGQHLGQEFDEHDERDPYEQPVITRPAERTQLEQQSRQHSSRPVKQHSGPSKEQPRRKRPAENLRMYREHRKNGKGTRYYVGT